MSVSISAIVFDSEYTFNVFSLVLFVSSLFPVPGGSINFKHSDKLQKYLFDIHCANLILFSLILSF